MRRAARRDEPETEIVKALRKAGCLVLYCHHPDLIVFFRGRVHLLECKRRSGKLTESQEKLIRDGWPLHIVRTTEEAFAAMGLETT